MNSIRNFFNPGNSGPFSNMAEFARKFQEFARNPVGAILSMRNVNVPQNFSGGPEELAKYLINSGQMPKEQFDQFAQTANQIGNLLPKP